MSKLEQMRRGIERLIGIDGDAVSVTRNAKGESATHKIRCRVSYQAGGVWPVKQWEGGLTMDTTPFVLARHDADIAMNDILAWRGKHYQAGQVTRPEIDGGAVCTQAPLTEVAYER